MPKKAASEEKTLTPERYAEIKEELFRAFFDLVEVTPPLGERYDFMLRQKLEKVYDELDVKLPAAERERMLKEAHTYIADYGPIQPFLDDALISEVMVNGPNQIYIEKFGEIIPTDIQYDNNRHVRFAINHIINPLGRFVDFNHPVVDARLPDGSRVNAVIPPVSQQGPCITIRKFLKDKLTLEQLIELGSITQQMADFLSVCVASRLNVIVAGNTSSGKTTFLNILARYIPDTERIITIEDAAELALIQTHKISLEAKPADHKGEGLVTIRDLVRNSLRMRPDRIIVGEVRGGEAIDMLQAMNTGHDGSMTTVHSNSPRDTVSRLETMALMSGFDLPIMAIRKQMASAVDLIVYLNRMPDGTRKCTQITEVVGMEGEVVTLTDLYKFNQTGLDSGKIVGTFRPTGLRPLFVNKIEAAGYKLEPRMFIPGM